MNKKPKILVLYGGKSAEHEVSLESAKFILKSLNPEKYQVTPVLITKEGEWQLLPTNKKADFSIITDHDLVFPIIHGSYGEDGLLQGLLEMIGVPYVGPNVLAAAIAMDKDIAKRLAQNAGIAVGPYCALHHSEWQANPEYYRSHSLNNLSYPLFVKPANAGSSVGVTKVLAPEKLSSALESAFSFDSKALIERAIDAQEIEVAVLGNCAYPAEIITSIPGEIAPSREFYSYDAKYLDADGAKLLVPANITSEQATEVKSLAIAIFKVLAGVGMARIDFLLDRATGVFYFNEANTVPGFTAISMYPRLFAEAGLTGEQLIERLIELAQQQHAIHSKLRRTR